MSTPLTAQVIFSFRDRRAVQARARQPQALARRLPGRPVLGWLCLAAAGAAWGADSHFGDAARASLQQEAEAAGLSAAYDVDSVELPSMGEAMAPPWAAPGAAQPGSSFNSTQHIGVTRWLTPEAPHTGGRFGLSLGMSAPAPSAAGAPLAGGALPPASLDLGVRWRSRLDSGRHLDISAWTRPLPAGQPQDAMGMIWQTQPPMYGTRVEVQWASSRTRGLVPEFGAVGVQLQGGSRLVLRARKGGPMLYYRAKF